MTWFVVGKTTFVPKYDESQVITERIIKALFYWQTWNLYVTIFTKIEGTDPSVSIFFHVHTYTS